MKATELRIGNYVWDDYSGEMLVCAILESSAVYLQKTIKLPSGQYLIKDIEPIPLTEEWLLKFYFDKWENESYTQHENHLNYCLHNAIDGTFDFKVYLSESWYGAKNTNPEEIIKHTEKYWGIKIDHDILYFFYELKYVHQLQNLYFALTGEELTLKTS